MLYDACVRPSKCQQHVSQCLLLLQERLLVSVIPSDLTDEIRRRMMNKVRSPSMFDRRRSTSRKFQEMYVQVHEHVRCVPAVGCVHVLQLT